MSAELLAKIEESKKKAIQKGTVINLRVSDLTKGEKAPKMKYSWYQTPTKVGIEIPYTVEKKEELKVTFKKDKVIIEFPLKTGGHYFLELNLYKEIITARTKKLHRLHSIEIMMEKKDPNVSWYTLTKDATSLAQAEETMQITYPSSSKTKKNWDKIDKEIEQDMLKNPEQFAVDPGMMFFQEIFKNADPEKRRAMMKSFQTSDGTVLSTDWGEVSKKDYEGKDRPSPPKGQQWKKREI